MKETDAILAGKSIDDLLESMQLVEMANMLGINVKVEHINFSFYFSINDGNKHGIRVKIQWKPNRFKGDGDGILELHGAYEYFTKQVGHLDQKDLENARKFFKKYKVLFAAVWEDIIDPSYVQDYLRKLIDFKTMLKFLEVDQHLLLNVKNLSELEKVVRKNKLFNMND